MKQFRSWSVCTLFVMFFIAGCSDDTDNNNNKQNEDNNTVMCPIGERYNPIAGRCVPFTVTNNQNNKNNPPGDMGKDMNGGQDMTIADMKSDMTGEDMSSGDMSTGQDMSMMDMPADMPAGDMSANCGYGKVHGRACAPSGAGVAGAVVTIEGIDCNTGQPFTLTQTTDANGEYTFDPIASGQHDATINSGSFNRRFTVSLGPGEDVDLTQQASKYCIETNNVKIAVIEGAYDNVEGILQQLQLTYDVKGNDRPQGGTDKLADTIAFLRDLNAMKQYNIIFINCGNLWGRIQQEYKQNENQILTNLRDYVIQGGSLYTSDLAHPFIERALPNQFDFLGTDTDVSQAWDGYAPQKIQSTIIDPQLQAALNKSMVEVDFPHDPAGGVLNNNWAMLEGVTGTNTKVYMTGNAQRCSTGSTFNPCPGTDAVLMNAPLLVSYKDPINGGAAVFTSFHNERQHAISQDILNILKF